MSKTYDARDNLVKSGGLLLNIGVNFCLSVLIRYGDDPNFCGVLLAPIFLIILLGKAGECSEGDSASLI